MGVFGPRIVAAVIGFRISSVLLGMMASFSSVVVFIIMIIVVVMLSLVMARVPSIGAAVVEVISRVHIVPAFRAICLLVLVHIIRVSVSVS
jgi:hypothetical protein